MPDREHELNDDLKRIEGRLLGWAPAAPGIDRDRLLFEAGRAAASTNSPRIYWPLATAATALVAIGAAWGWAQEHSRRQDAEMALAEARQVRPQPRPIAPPRLVANRDPIPIDPSSYLALSRRLAESGELDEEPILETHPGDHPRPDELILTPRRFRSAPGRIDL